MRSQFSGGPTASPPIFNVPPVVLWTTIVIVVIYFAIALLPKALGFKIEYILGVTPAQFVAGPKANGGIVGMIRPLFSTILVHGSIQHLGMNSIWLIAFGAPVARRLGAGGGNGFSNGSISSASIFLLFFALSGAAAALFFILFHQKDYSLLVGASGSISGLLGAVIRFGLRRPAFFAPGPQPLLPLFDRSVVVASLVVIALNASTHFLGGVMGEANVAWEAHIGGYLFGLLTFPLFEHWARLTSGAK